MKKILQSFGLILAFLAIFQTQSVQAVVNATNIPITNYAAYLPGTASAATTNTTSYIQIPDLPITALPFTLEMMVKPESLNTYAGFWSDRTTTNATNLQYGNNVAYMRLDYGGVNDHATVPDKGYAVPLMNQWNHVALVITATEIKIYLNGTLYKKSITNTQLPSVGATYIGWDNPAGTGNRTMKGQFDEIRFWNYERTASDLATNKTTTLTGSESGLIAYYNFDGQNANDLTANALNATVASGVTYVANTFTAYVPTITDWKAPLIGASVTGLNTFPSQYGWRCNSNTGLWSQVNVASNVRYQDNITTFTYNSVAWTGRAMYVRWDGTPSMGSIYTYPVYLEANKVYSFSGKCGWNSVGGTSTYSDFIFGISANQNGSGTDITSKTVRVLVANKLKFYDVPMSIVVPTNGVYYLTIKNATDNTGALGVIADLAIVENTVVDKTNLISLISTATTMNNTPQAVGTSDAYTLLGTAITNAQAVVDNGGASVMDVALQEGYLQTAINNVNSAILIYSRKSAWTTFPVDATSLIVNPSFESTIDYAFGWTNYGPFVKQTNASLPNKNGTNYIEKYTGGGGFQTNLKISQKINSVPNGTYVLTVNAQAIQQSNGSFPGGAFIFANSSRTEVFAARDYSVLVKVTDNTLEVGFEVISSGNWMSLDNFRLSALSDGSVPYYFTNPSSLLLDANNLNKTFTITGDYLSSNSTLTAPAGIILSKSELTPSEVIAGVTVTATFDNSTVITAGAITVANGSTSKSIAVNTSVDSGCFTPLYSGITNLVADPFLNSLETYTPSWGLSAAGASINNDLAFVYCGSGSGKVTGTRAGSIAYPLTGKIIPNTNYRIKAKVNITAGSFKFNMAGWSGALADIGTVFNADVIGWQDFDLKFTTGATLGGSPLFYFNNYDANTLGTGYIDNVEMYAVPKVYTSAASLTFLGLGSKKVAVRAVSLTSGITITAPASFSVSPGTMLSTVSGSTADSLTVTFNGPNSASGYVYFTSGLVKDSVLVTGTVAPTLLASANYVSLDELNTVGTFTVSGGNLITGITMSAPEGITLSPTSLPSSANGAVVTVTYDGNANSTGYITLTSGAASTRVRIRASKNSDTFTSLYPSGTNLIVDPYLNDLANFGGWGTKSINTDTAFVYSGSRSGKLSGGQCSGSIDKVLTGVMKANTKYRVKAMIYAVDGSFQIGVYGWGKADTTSIVSTTGSWQTVDFQFTTTATLAGAQGIFFNSCWIGGMNGYIDNFEAYEVPSVATSVNSLGLQNQSIYIQSGKIASDFNLSQASEVEFSIYNMQGMLISKEKATYAAGQNHKVINANLSTGVYVVRMAANGRFFTQKVIK